jgi:DnaJ-class molecular chaperone
MTSPAGARDGQTLRLRGKGQPGLGGGPPGNAYVEIRVSAHPIFTRAGNDIETEIEWPIGFDEAILGAKVEVPTLSGRVAMGGPKRATTGQQLRLKGTGIARERCSWRSICAVEDLYSDQSGRRDEAYHARVARSDPRAAARVARSG